MNFNALICLIIPLVYASATSNIEIDAFGFTKLHRKCLNGQLYAVKKIISDSKLSGLINFPDKSSKKLPLHILIEKAAVISNKPQVVEIINELLSKGSDLNAQTDSGWTPINLAVYMASVYQNYPLEIVDAVLSQSNSCVVINIKTHGQTVLHLAASSRLTNDRSKILVEKLINACGTKIDYLSVNDDGWTALKVSMAVGNTETINTLKKVTPSMSNIMLISLIATLVLLFAAGVGIYYYFVHVKKVKKLVPMSSTSPTLQLPELPVEISANNNDEMVEESRNENENEVRRTSSASSSASASTGVSASSVTSSQSESLKKIN